MGPCPGRALAKAEAAENRKNSVVAREFEVALPHELNDEQRSVLATAIGQALVARYGFAVQASIHSPGSRDGLNHHVHLLATTRRLTSDGFAEKTRELDGGASGKIEIEWIRQTIASTINEHLAAAGIDARVDHRRLEVQAEDALARGDWAEAMVLSRQPTKHVGKTATALARNGVMTDRAAENARIIRENEEAFERLLAQAEQEEGQFQTLLAIATTKRSATVDAELAPGTNFKPLCQGWKSTGSAACASRMPWVGLRKMRGCGRYALSLSWSPRQLGTWRTSSRPGQTWR